MKASEFREHSDAELRKRRNEMARELWKFRFQNHTNQLDDTDQIRRIRRDIARVNTLLSERGVPQQAAKEQNDG